jgi:hypothetical protein
MTKLEKQAQKIFQKYAQIPNSKTGINEAAREVWMKAGKSKDAAQHIARNFYHSRQWEEPTPGYTNHGTAEPVLPTIRFREKKVNSKLEVDGWTPWSEAVDTKLNLKNANSTAAKTIEETIDADRELYRLRDNARVSEKKYKHLLNELGLAEERLSAALAIKSDFRTAKVPVPKAGAKGEAAVIWLASDWHIEERVDPRTINYLNEYNPDISSRRMKAFFRNGLKLTRKERQDVDIKTLVLWLGGDLVSGYIHEELMEGNYMSPTEAILFAQEHIAGGIKMLLEDGEFQRIIVPCSYGNHGRTTPKKRISTGYKNSYEWLMYQNLAMHFAGVKEVEFQVSDGYLNYVEVYGKTLRFHHGDSVGYGGGIGGISIPLNKFIGKTNHQRWADCDSIGHFHQRTPYNHANKFQINGSLIGFNAYAQSIGASPETPMQCFQVLDSKRGFTGAYPILLDE